MSKLKILVTLTVPDNDWDTQDVVDQFGHCLETACGGVDWLEYIDSEEYKPGEQNE